jgi:predicted CXXCH cytochrome family protein
MQEPVMLASAAVLLVLLPALLIVFQMCNALGGRRGAALAALVILLPASAWCALDLSQRQEAPPVQDLAALPPVPSQACFKCHESHYTSWQRTFHRTMTREATPEYVKGDFDNAVHQFLGVTSHLIRRGDRFFLDTVDPAWAMDMAQRGMPLDQAESMPRREMSVDRLVGSHWFQQLLHCDEQGRYLRLPLAYHIVEGRWIHINGAFLKPDSPSFYGHTAIWNETCLYCHNTRPSKNPQPLLDEMPGYRTEVGELGIACEACHGPGDRHIRAHQNPARRVAQRASSEADPTIVNPARLAVARADDICAKCHGRSLPRFEAWNQETYAEPFLAGRKLATFYSLFWSEAEMRLQTQGQDTKALPRRPPGPRDGSFWGDGTPLTTALEYHGMALSACYQDGHGKMSCLSCHSMHQSEPDHQMKDGMRTNAACYGCHESYRERLVEHTHHTAESSGSLCYNCHMPHQVYSLLDTHRSHRITIPRVRDSVGTGKPHACNLCHLDKSLGWTGEQLSRWYGTKPELLSKDERTIAASVLELARGDARTRAVVAGAFSWPAAQAASGRDWPALLLTRTLENERYEAVRYLMHRALRSLHGNAADDFDYRSGPAERAARLRGLRLRMDSAARPERSRYPYLPLTETGLFADDVYDRLLRTRNDPDVFINE